MDFLEIAKEIEFNAKAEAQAVLDYTELMKNITNSNLEESDKNELLEVIKEIVSDELNHEERLREIYTYLTKIEPNKD